MVSQRYEDKVNMLRKIERRFAKIFTLKFKTVDKLPNDCMQWNGIQCALRKCQNTCEKIYIEFSNILIWLLAQICFLSN